MIFTHPDTVTYWTPTYDDDGNEVFGTLDGIKVAARVGSRSEEVVTEQGKEPQISKLAIYVDSLDADINEDDQIAVGDFEDQTVGDVKTSRRVLAKSNVLTGTTETRLLV